MSGGFKHWSDITAERIIRDKGEKDVYTIASGITPSGTVHFGNFREVITVDLVARALRKKGKKVRFIFSWDDYDTFRKIPKNMPNQDMLENYMFQPIVDTPDPYEKDESYARHHQLNFEGVLPEVGIKVEFLYQAKKYRAGEYRDLVAKTLDNTQVIKDILNEHRSSPLAADWHPVSVYCSKCNTDKTKVSKYDSGTIHYDCEKCENSEDIKVSESDRVKLPWRMDWPMRWSFEDVDFEPGGKDHSSEGGSYTTAKEIAVKVYDQQPPVYLQYDFVSIRGAGGKMSSSSGEVITLQDVLKVYEPEMVRWIFASNRTNLDFAIAFDQEVIKTYEEYDKMERQALKIDEVNDKKFNYAHRIYEASQLGDMPSTCAFQPSFRHLCNVLQINDLDTVAAKKDYTEFLNTEADNKKFDARSQRAVFWLKNYAPEEFIFAINKEVNTSFEVSPKAKEFLAIATPALTSEWDNFSTDKELHERLYEMIHQVEADPKEVFLAIYQLLINREKGPKLAGFLRSIGKERVLKLLTV